MKDNANIGRLLRSIRPGELVMDQWYTLDEITALPWYKIYKKALHGGEQVIGECLSGHEYFFWRGDEVDAAKGYKHTYKSKYGFNSQSY